MRLYHNSTRSLRATKGSVAISFSLTLYEIASVVLLPRNDIKPPLHSREGASPRYDRHNVDEVSLIAVQNWTSVSFA